MFSWGGGGGILRNVPETKPAEYEPRHFNRKINAHANVIQNKSLLAKVVNKFL